MIERSVDRFEIVNPKQPTQSHALAEHKIFPYYAGYSRAFATKLLSSMGLRATQVVLDPWNGAGTTTSTATELGVDSYGFDLNPAMIIVAKAALLPADELASIEPLAHTILDVSRAAGREFRIEDDPLDAWLTPSAVASIRGVEGEINRSLICHTCYANLGNSGLLAAVTPIAAYFYVVLFRTVRSLLSAFIPSNPTWVRVPKKQEARLRLSQERVEAEFLRQARALVASARLGKVSSTERNADIRLADSRLLPLTPHCVDAVVTSPPYCTRIDYAVATAIELAILRIGGDQFERLRRWLIGTSTVFYRPPVPNATWGRTCLDFLDALFNHKSKASQTYYYKNHASYYAGLYSSLEQIGRVVRPGGVCVVVAQDSFYKDIHNDVPAAITEMLEGSLGFDLVRRQDFPATKSMARINSRARRYLDTRENIESVLCFRSPRDS
jgi:DNA modification methylase